MAAVFAQSDALARTLREVCERLAPIDTTPCSPAVAHRLSGQG